MNSFQKMTPFEKYIKCQTESKYRALAEIEERKDMLLSRWEPLNSLGIDRKNLKILFDYLSHGDKKRLFRECEQATTKENVKEPT